MKLKVFAAPGLDKLGPAGHESKSAPGYMSIECCHEDAAVSDFPWFHSKKAVCSEDSKGVSDRVEAD